MNIPQVIAGQKRFLINFEPRQFLSTTALRRRTEVTLRGEALAPGGDDGGRDSPQHLRSRQLELEPKRRTDAGMAFASEGR